jgi:hypothetical protein
VVELDAEQSAKPQEKMKAPGGNSKGGNLQCSPGAHESPGAWELVILLAVAALGALLGTLLILLAPDHALFTSANKGALDLWAGLFGLLCGYGLAATVVMTHWSWQLLKTFDPRIAWRSACGWILTGLLTIVVIFQLTYRIPAGSVNGQPVHPFSQQIQGLSIAGGIAAIPGFVGFLAVRSLAGEDSQWKKWKKKPQCQILMVVWLRQNLRRLLATFGLFLTLYVVATAARRQLILAYAKNVYYPSDYPVLIGLIFAAVLALYHVWATMAINSRCQRLLDEYAPIPSPGADDISTPLSRRRDLAALLGADSSWQQTFQNGVFVLAPLLTALIGTALPK